MLVFFQKKSDNFENLTIFQNLTIFSFKKCYLSHFLKLPKFIEKFEEIL